jgi:hypothetical protein
MKTETNKTIKLSSKEAATLIVSLDYVVEKENEEINFFYEKLNGAGTTEDVRKWTNFIKKGKERITRLKSVAYKIADSEEIITHHLKHIS